MQDQSRVSSSSRKLTSGIATEPAQIVAAQQLRYEVFTSEYDADIETDTGIDEDRFDPWCEHFVVMNQKGEVVATTRLLHGEVAAKIGGFYSEDEFDLDRLKQNSGVFAELGRTCIRSDFRSGAALSMLWSEVAQYLVQQGIDYLLGCASISMLDGGHKAWRITQQVQQEYLAAEEFRVTPKRTLPHLANQCTQTDKVVIPPLIRSYMRLGAEVCGDPCWDPAFRCADLLVLLRVDNLAARYVRRYNLEARIA
ncbi:GNAT family N-acetyltransferase [Marinobacter sp. KMM 10035]|uniref:GNAT family N-acetyltransferase n=1 Tax=Marinobacter sp. KMM 10035 TaxID=3134034 RepID=UPI0039784FD2